MIKGFFTRQEWEKKDSPKLQDFDGETECLSCGLFRNSQHPKMKFTGNGELKCLIIAEAPGKEEDTYNKQLVGDVGKFFRNKLSKHGLSLDRDFFKINAVNCLPLSEKGNTGNPTPEQVKFCRPHVLKTIADLKPQYIWLMGESAITSILGDRFKELAVGRWRGIQIPDRKTKAWLFPLFHPSYARRQERDENITALYNRDLDWAIENLGIPPFEHEDEDTHIHTLYNFDDINDVLDKIRALSCRTDGRHSIYIDYETNRLKPQNPGSKIISMSLCADTSQGAFSFPLEYRDFWSVNQLNQLKAKIKEILQGPAPKEAHNFKFEDNWGHFVLGATDIPWGWDSMIAAHIIDPRPRYTGLKFQLFIHFGIDPYDKYVGPYLESTDSEGFNKAEEVNLDDLLLYSGLDSYGGKKLAEKQKKIIRETGRLQEAYQFFHEGIIELSSVQKSGICIDEVYYHERRKKIKRRVERLKKNLLSSPEALKYNEVTGKILDLGSATELGKLFFDILGYKPVYTGKNNYSTNRKTLETLDLPFVEDLLFLRNLEKIQGTYFSQFLREVCNGRMYPFFDLHIPKSLRGSSSKPNFQNIPKRDELAQRECRGGILPSPGFKFLETDFKSMEVCVAACYTRDPELIKYITDPTTDMHRDTGMDLWMLPSDEVSKLIRFFAKNNWVFAEFYGSYYANCAEDLWRNCIDLKTVSGVPLRQHLRSKGITEYQTFVEHCKDVEHKFWKERFRVYDKWKEINNREFNRKGYMETFFGFQLKGNLEMRQINNHPIQGTAFHLLLWTLIKMSKFLKANKMKSRIVGQIHDSIVTDLHPAEEKIILKTILEIATVETRATFDWIIVPLSIENEITPINGSWLTKKEIK